SAAVVVSRTVAHGSDVTTLADRQRGRAEVDVERLCAVAIAALGELVAEGRRRTAAGDGLEVACIGVTGQQHGVALLGEDGRALGPAITWQDQRGAEPAPGGDGSVVDHLVRAAGGAEAFARMGCQPATGYLGVSLCWLKLLQRLPPPGSVACFIPDVLAARLADCAPVVDATNGGSSALFDIVAGDWDWGLIRRLGLPPALFPPVRASGAPLGGLSRALAERVGLAPGTPVAVAVGDNQASFIGSVPRPAECLLVNVGTGAQVSAWVESYGREAELDTRAYPGGGYLLAGAGLFGGTSYALLQGLFWAVGQEMFGAADDTPLYARMTALAAATPPGADGLRWSPHFSGTRADPGQRGVLSGLSAANLTPGHLARALLEGVAEALWALCARMQPRVGARPWLVGAGNALRQNAVLQEAVAARFGQPLHLAPQVEEAALGAALMAAAGVGAYASVQDATARWQTHPSA
ncbi:MAG: FGGY family carbohydrate kinase, partial [Chloroflexota bacterium]